MQNKLCWTGAWLRSKGYNVRCPGHITCTANTEAAKPLSEYEMGKHIGQNFALDDVLIQHVCSDGDARGCDGVNESMQLKNRLWETLRQCDTTHLGVSQYKKNFKV